MIRVGCGKPKITGWEGDPHHPVAPLFGANDWFWMDLSTWMAVNDFQTFEKDAPAEALTSLLGVDRLNYLIKRAGGQTVWQLNCYHKGLQDYVRIAVPLGEMTVYRWTWVECFVKRPILAALAWFMNTWHKEAREKAYAALRSKGW